MRRRSTQPAGIAIAGSSFVIAANGYSDGPTKPLAKFLDEHGATSVTMITHPLTREEPSEHRVDVVSGGQRTGTARRLPNRPPLTYAFDPLVPLVPPRADVWFGFNCVTTTAALAHRSVGRYERVIHWNVDFVPQRFGPGLLTRVYDGLDRYCCTHADGRVEISEAAKTAREQHYQLGEGTPVEVIPMGMWTSTTPQADVRHLAERRVAFLGSLVPRMGIDLLIESISILKHRGRPVTADIIGGGTLLSAVRERVERDGLDDVVTVHGFVPDFDDALRILARTSLGIAPYDVDPDSFTRFADPGKIKAYLSVGLPILTTDVPPNAGELERSAGAEIVPDNAEQLANRIDAILNDNAEWRRRHESARDYARRYDWDMLLGKSLPALGITT